MNRIIEIAAMSIGGLSLFIVCFVGFAAMSGRDMSQVAVIGKLFPAPAHEGEAQPGTAGGEVHEEPKRESELSDAAVVEASLGVLSAWTLPSPYSTSELRVLSEEIKRKRTELEERELALARREREMRASEQELGERLASLEGLRSHLESLQAEIAKRELQLTDKEAASRASQDAGWADVAGVIGAIEDNPTAARKLQDYEPAEAAKILRSLGDEARASEILNAIDGKRWKEYVAAYTAEGPRLGAKRK